MRYGMDGRYIQDHFPGIARYTFNLIHALAGIAPETEWVVVHNPRLKNTRYDLKGLARRANVRLIEVDVPAFSWAEQTRLPQLARALGLDLWHAPYYVMPYHLPCPSVLTFYDAIAHHFPATLSARWKQPLFELMTHLAVHSARRFLAISDASRSDLVRFYRVPPERITVTPLAVDAHLIPPSRERVVAVRARYALPERYVLYLGSNKPHKNLVRLVEAFERVAVHEPEMHLVIAGHWDARFPQARERAAVLAAGARIVFAGAVADEDLPGIYGGAGAFVFPSLYEGFGLPVLEAMACGAPVICSNTSSLPDVAGDAALLVDPNDTAGLAEAILHVLRDARLGEAMRQAGLAQAARFSWERTARETLAVYRRVTG